MPSEPEDVTTSNEEAAAFAETSDGRDVTLAAVRRLEAAAGRAGTGRETDWLGQVAADLSVLERAVAAERHEASRPDSLLSMIARDYPRRFSSRIRQLREQHEDIAQTIASLRTQLRCVSPRSMSWTSANASAGLPMPSAIDGSAKLTLCTRRSGSILVAPTTQLRKVRSR